MERDKPFLVDVYFASTSGTQRPTVGARVKDLIRNHPHIELFKHHFKNAIQLFKVVLLASLFNPFACIDLSGGRTQFAKFLGKALIGDDGEAIEGVAAEEVEFMGRVTFFINRTDADDIPV